MAHQRVEVERLLLEDGVHRDGALHRPPVVVGLVDEAVQHAEPDDLVVGPDDGLARHDAVQQGRGALRAGDQFLGHRPVSLPHCFSRPSATPRGT